ncbi:MAG: hypothetical protein JO108_16525 [Acidobacteriaceae bacterium]|nr:hypothetical protein [Acidobacteriaceae bacterium]
MPVWNYIITAASSAAAVLAALMGRKLAAGTPGPRCTIWCVLACLVAFAPAALAITPPLVARRLARHDRLAEQRFRSLRQAFERARVRHADGASICDGVVLSRYYSGPPFSSEDCWRITGNYVKQDGYSFMIYCHGKNAYVLDARPFPGSGEGTRHFCADEFGQKCGELGWKTHPYVCPTCAE